MPLITEDSVDRVKENTALPPVVAFTARVWVERIITGTATSDEDIEARVYEVLGEEVDQRKYRVVRLGLTSTETEWN